KRIADPRHGAGARRDRRGHHRRNQLHRRHRNRPGHPDRRAVHRRHHQRHDAAQSGCLLSIYRARWPDPGRRAGKPAAGGQEMSLRIAMLLALAAVWAGAMPAARAQETASSWDKPPMIGMYVHQHWSDNRPYAARTWTMDDWKGYLDGLKKIGFNTVLIWP